MSTYIHQHHDWPQFTWDSVCLEPLLAAVRHQQGRLLGELSGLGFALQQEATLRAMTLEVMKSHEIEGERLPDDQVRSSLARGLGLDVAGLVPSDQKIDGVVEVALDAARHAGQPLTAERLFAWHAALFPTGFTGPLPLRVGMWRDDQMGPMQVVSGAMGREKVHFQAPPANVLEVEMARFLEWFNTTQPTLDPVLKAGLAHLWFLTIHPFDDDNGRIGRTLADLLLARADGLNQRFYSLSAQIQLERNAYYQYLERTQAATLDVTKWLEWFLGCLGRALAATGQAVNRVLRKQRFWDRHRHVPLHPRQHAMLGRLLDGFTGHLTSSKWAKITHCSQDTAARDIQALVAAGVLEKAPAGGRSTHYALVSR